MPKQIIDLPVEAGVYTEQTARGAMGQWKNSDKVRFRKGLPEKIGGWIRVVETQLKGIARKMWDWSSLDAQKWASIGTEKKLYLFNTDTIYDITPLRRTVALTNPFDTTIGSDIVQVTDTAHGASAGDFVRFSGATTVGGITIDGEYEIQAVLGANTYQIQDDQVASSTATGGGSVSAQYDIPVGEASTGFGTGWNTGTWSQETWNTPRTTSSFISRLRTWSLDNWGEDLIANPRRGAIYWWDRTNGTAARAVQLEFAPERCNYAIISQRDRHLFALGCTDFFTEQFDPLLIRWCSKEDFNDWEPTSTNTAGDLRLYRGSEIITALRTRGEILVFTDVSVHQINFLGGTAVYGLTVAGENVSILGPNAAIAVDTRVFFMAEADFYVYDGVLRPLPCTVRNFVYSSINEFQKDKVIAGLNREFNEIWWFYPGQSSELWVESDFTTGLRNEDYQLQSMAGGDRYSVAFNAAGYVYLLTHTASTVYDSIWLLRSAAPIEDGLESEHELVFTLNGTTCDAGIAIDVTDLAGSADQAQDNIQGIVISVNATANRLNMRKRTSVGSLSDLDNAATFYDLSALGTPITLTDAERYALIVRRSGNTITAYLWDEANDLTQQVASVALSASEILLYTRAGRVGPILRTQLQTQSTDDFRAESFRVGPVNSLVNATTRGVNDEVNRYVVYNYEEQTWAIGTMDRSAWRDRSPLFQKPFAVALDGYLYKHEVTSDDNGAAMPSVIETYDMELPEAGEDLAHVDQLIPDFLELDGTVDITLSGKKYPQAAAYQVKGPYPVTTGTNKVSTRIRARQASLKISTDGLGDSWRMGTMRIRVRPHGKRA